MSCEMCGKFAGSDGQEYEVDGVPMFLCRGCSKFGKKPSHTKQGLAQEESEVTFVKSKPGGKGPSVSHVRVQSGSGRPTQVTRRKRRDTLLADEELVDDFGDIIKEARKAKGLSLEQFAQMINEKVSLLQKIEKSEFRPSDSLVLKIERKLDVSLKEETAAPIISSFASTKETTLGDIVKLKKKKK